VYFDWYIRNIFFFGTFGRAIGRSTYHPRFFFLGRRSNRLFPGRVNNFLARFERVNLVDGRFVKVTFVVRMIYIFIFIRSCADGPPIWNIFWRRMWNRFVSFFLALGLCWVDNMNWNFCFVLAIKNSYRSFFNVDSNLLRLTTRIKISKNLPVIEQATYACFYETKF